MYTININNNRKVRRADFFKEKRVHTRNEGMVKAAVIFDMDGVISDSEYVNILAKHKLLQNLGIEVDWNYHDQFLGTTYEFMWEKMKEEFHLPEEVSDYVQAAESQRDKLILRDGLRPIPGVVELIQRLYRAGIPMAVASSSSKRNIISNLSMLGIYRYFQEIISGEECKNGRLDSEIFLKAASMLRKEPENCVVIEDSIHGVQAAKTAGMKCIGFANPKAADLDFSLADLVVSDFNTLTVERLMQA